MSAEPAYAYFCCMKYWIIVLLSLVILACNEPVKPKTPDTLTSDEMPAPVQELFKKTAANPDSISLRLQLVNALDSLGAYKQALGQMDSLIRKDSLNYGLWYRKALLQESTKDTTGALRSYRYAIRIYPSPDAQLGAANLLAERKDSTALLICRQVAALNMGREYNAHCHFITGIYFARTGNKQKAIQAFNNTIINDLNYTEAYMEKGFLFYDDKQYSDALQVYQTLITVKNTYADGYYWLAKTQEAMNNKAAAIDNYQKSLTLDPKLKEATAALQRLGVK